MGQLTRPTLLAIVGLTAFGCGGAARASRLRGVADAEIAAPAPGATEYATEARGAPVLHAGVGRQSEWARAVERGVRDGAEARGRSLVGDGRLALLAGWTAEHLGDGGVPPPSEVIEFFARHLGLVETVPHVLLLGETEPLRLERGLQTSVQTYLARRAYTHWGAAVVQRQGLTLAVVVLSLRVVMLEPVARAHAVGSAIAVRAGVTPAYHGARVLVVRPDGAEEPVPLPDHGPLDFTLRVEARGVHRLVLRARGPLGEQVLADFPLYVGIEPPRSVRPVRGGRADETVDEAGASLLAWANSLRGEQGLPTLALDERLRAAAEAHAAELASTGELTHESATTGSPLDRAERAGVRAALVLENLGRGATSEEIHRSLVGSVEHRRNLLHPEATHGGVGVAIAARAGGRELVVVELLARIPPEIDLASAPTALVDGLNRARAARRAPPVELDATLANLAQAAVLRYFADAALSEQDAVELANADLRPYAIAYQRVGGVMAVVQSLEDAARLEPALDAGVRRVGVGIHRARRTGASLEETAVLILLAWPREAPR